MRIVRMRGRWFEPCTWTRYLVWWFDMKWYVNLSATLKYFKASDVICVTWKVWYVKMRLGVGWEGVDLAHALERDSWKMLVWCGMSGWFDMKWYVILSKMLEWLGDSIVICVTWNVLRYVNMADDWTWWLVCVMWYVRMSGTWFDEWMIEWVKEW